MTVAVRMPVRKQATPDPAALLAWYDRHARVLPGAGPWRARKGEQADPYRVWLSEIMLQQTTVKTVAPYYAKFLTRWPTVEALAAASLDDVLRAWAGLGYYARARNLHACARAVVERHGGIFPAEIEALRALPGIGDYTAAAVAAIAFDRAGGAGRRQCRAGGGAAVRAGRGIAGGQAGAQAAGEFAAAAAARRRFRARL